SADLLVCDGTRPAARPVTGRVPRGGPALDSAIDSADAPANRAVLGNRQLEQHLYCVSHDRGQATIADTGQRTAQPTAGWRYRGDGIRNCLRIVPWPERRARAGKPQSMAPIRTGADGFAR